MSSSREYLHDNEADRPVDHRVGEGGDEFAEEDTSGHDTNAPHPYMTYSSLASSNYEAGPSFVNAYFAKQPKQSNPLQKPAEVSSDTGKSVEDGNTGAHRGQGPAAAAMVKCRQGLTADGCGCASCTGKSPAAASEVSVADEAPCFIFDERMHSKDRGILTDMAESLLASDPDIDDDVTSRKIESEIRTMMRRVHIKGTEEELCGMNESPDELRRIADALIRCMSLRDKYMEISGQHESSNPKNQAGWSIYPPPPPPAWHSFTRDSSGASHRTPVEEFDINKCAIPGDDGCVFAMGDDGVYAVYGSEDDRVSGAEPISKAP
ncbi:AMP deaminase, partial [Coemansia erecta]